MGILVFQALQVTVGCLIAVLIGRRLSTSDTFGAVLSGAFSAFAVGVSLAFISPLLVAGLCVAVLSRPGGCFATDDKNIWLMAIPLVAIPFFFAAILLARRRARRAAEDG